MKSDFKSITANYIQSEGWTLNDVKGWREFIRTTISARLDQKRSVQICTKRFRSSLATTASASSSTIAVYRHTLLYQCCPNPYINLEYKLFLRRKPLFYIANLILPTAIITLISLVHSTSVYATQQHHNPGRLLYAVERRRRAQREDHTGHHDAAVDVDSAAHGLRQHADHVGVRAVNRFATECKKTASSKSLTGRFYLTMIFLISIGTVMSALIIVLQKRGIYGEPMTKRLKNVFVVLSKLTSTRLPREYFKNRVQFSWSWSRNKLLA